MKTGLDAKLFLKDIPKTDFAEGAGNINTCFFFLKHFKSNLILISSLSINVLLNFFLDKVSLSGFNLLEEKEKLTYLDFAVLMQVSPEFLTAMIDYALGKTLL